MNTCPCCSEKLLRHIRHNSVYWFCTHCWQEMPDLSSEAINARRPILNLSDPLGVLVGS